MPINKIIDTLNNNFSFDQDDNAVVFSNGPADIPQIEIANAFASAKISLQGAHILSWKPHSEGEVIWLSDDAVFAREKSVRGGIPICWPWFGAADENRDSNIALPAHGFARTVFWQIIDTAALASGETQIIFKLDTSTLSVNTEELWPTPTTAIYKVVVGKRLSLELTTTNNSHETFSLGQALHTYFSVSDVRETSVHGLDGKTYLDKTDEFKRKQQMGKLLFTEEVDRIYLETPDDIIIDDKKRRVIIKKQGSKSTVVWNPWQTVADKMGDLGEDGYLKMLCVESANAAEDVVTIEPGESHTLQVSYEIGE